MVSHQRGPKGLPCSCSSSLLLHTTACSPPCCIDHTGTRLCEPTFRDPRECGCTGFPPCCSTPHAHDSSRSSGQRSIHVCLCAPGSYKALLKPFSTLLRHAFGAASEILPQPFQPTHYWRPFAVSFRSDNQS